MNKAVNTGCKLVVLALVFFSACKSKQVASTPAPPKAVVVEAKPEETRKANFIRQAAANSNRFDYYNARGKAAYKDAERSVDLDVNIVMENNKYVLFTATALLGIEVARVLVTPDSISIIDWLNRTHIVTDFKYLERLSGVKLNLIQLQHLFTGNMIFAPDAQQSRIDSVLNYIILTTPVKAGMRQVTYFHTSTIKPTRNTVEDQQANREFKLEYEEFHQSGTNLYPSDFNINIRAEKNIACRFTLNYFAFEKKKEINFVVPKSYKTVRM